MYISLLIEMMCLVLIVFQFTIMMAVANIRDRIAGKDLKMDYYDIEPNNFYLRLMESEIVFLEKEDTKLWVKKLGKFTYPRRDQAAYGNAGITYKFNRQTFVAKEWTPTMLKLRALLLEKTGYRFNYCHVNYYDEGMVAIGPHRDMSPGLDVEAPIACFSFGATRRFMMRHSDDSYQQGYEFENLFNIELEDNTLLVFWPPTNDKWLHWLFADAEIGEPRLSLTFRVMLEDIPEDEGIDQSTQTVSDDKYLGMIAGMRDLSSQKFSVGWVKKSEDKPEEVSEDRPEEVSEDKPEEMIFKNPEEMLFKNPEEMLFKKPEEMLFKKPEDMNN